MNPFRAVAFLAGIGMVLALGGCTYDYWQQTDRVGYHAGDAVKANLEAETVNPQSLTSYKKSGLGKDGVLVQPSGSGEPTPSP